MTKLNIDAIEDDKPVTLSVKLPASIHRDLIAYADYEARKREARRSNVLDRADASATHGEGPSVCAGQTKDDLQQREIAFAFLRATDIQQGSQDAFTPVCVEPVSQFVFFGLEPQGALACLEVRS